MRAAVFHPQGLWREQWCCLDSPDHTTRAPHCRSSNDLEKGLFSLCEKNPMNRASAPPASKTSQKRTAK